MNILPMPDFPHQEPGFVSLLKQHTPFVPHWENRPCRENETDMREKIHLQSHFPDPEDLLATAFFDFRRFLDETGLAGNTVPVECRFCSGLEQEEYILTLAPDRITVEGSDTEAIRRGIYLLRNRLAGSPFLVPEKIRRKPWLRNRISRCPFSPIKRPPFNVDELMNDVDYYPEEYLHRLAGEGINGLWLTITFREICSTSVRPASREAVKRTEKLRRIVEKCRRFGIRIWVFAIEPIFWSQASGNPLPLGCEELLGPGLSAENAGTDMKSFCPNSDKAQQYLYECTHDLFAKVPHLGGLLTISYGERMTSCLSMLPSHGGNVPCNHRCTLSLSGILSRTLEPMIHGMKDASPDAELISWLYMPNAEQSGIWVTQLPEKLSPDVTLALNFESGVTKSQLGKVRCGGDYWLSEAGPSDRFVMMAKAVSGHCGLAAKIQVGCSHECATVPLIPVPGILYRKYKAMKELGVRDVIQCWFFGNYPGVMDEAAGRLAFEDFQGTEEEFLLDLAKPVWGKDASKVAEAWQTFAESYGNYPLDTQFQYYGPMHDGTVWPLWLRQQMRSLTRSWKPDSFPAGDTLGECMSHFNLEELSILTGRLSSGWNKGVKILKTADCTDRDLELTLAEALDIMFRSGHNVLRFYALRNTLWNDFPHPSPLLEEIDKIIREEIHNARRLAGLCEGDPRLGYHSEAEVYKYSPEKLNWRISMLQSLLDEDLEEAKQALHDGKDLGKLLKIQSAAKAGEWYGENGIRWCICTESGKLKVQLKLQREECAEETLLLFFADSCGAEKIPEPVVIHPNGAEEVSAELEWGLLRYSPEFFFGVERVLHTKNGPPRFISDLPGKFSHESRLRLGLFSPCRMRLVSL